MMIRRKTQTIHVGKLPIGSNYPIRIQSMTNTHTQDIQATVEQSIELIHAGCEMVRITVPGIQDVENLRKIQHQIRKLGYDTPLIADVHFNPKVAEEVAHFVEKVRINPGNYVDKKVFAKKEYTENEYQSELNRIAERIYPLLKICKENGTVIRIGSNHGSLSDRITNRYGNTALGMTQSAMEFLEICNAFGFHNVIVSMKSSHVKTMMEATVKTAQAMDSKGWNYPLHLGVTEAGCDEEGRIKSAAGIGGLLALGYGDTIRVSLTESPVKEIPFAQTITNHIPSITKMTSSVFENNSNEPDETTYIAQCSAEAAALHYQYPLQNIQLNNTHLTAQRNQEMADAIMQALRIKITKTEFVSCPSCGRTQYDIQDLTQKVKQKFANYKGLKIATMGCIVNGPGEMADADYGIVGAGNGFVVVYQGEQRLTKHLSVDEALDFLENKLKNQTTNSI